MWHLQLRFILICNPRLIIQLLAMNILGEENVSFSDLSWKYGSRRRKENCSCSASLWINMSVGVTHPSTSYSSYTSRVIRMQLEADVRNLNLHALPTAAATLLAAVFVGLNDNRHCFSHISIIHHVFFPPPIRSSAMNELCAGTVRWRSALIKPHF